MVRHVSFGHLSHIGRHRRTSGGNALHSQRRVVLETETPVEGRIADQDAALTPMFRIVFRPSLTSAWPIPCR